MNKYLNIIKKNMEKINTKKHEHFLVITLIVVVILWIILYVIPETFASLFNSILGKIILLLFIVLVSFKNIQRLLKNKKSIYT
jgi:FtsH-binding integral membrane protein